MPFCTIIVFTNAKSGMIAPRGEVIGMTTIELPFFFRFLRSTAATAKWPKWLVEPICRSE